MTTKSGQTRPKTDKKVIDSSARCITCNKTCSMSGMCMKPWPEFTAKRREEAADDRPDAA
ncbi:MAG: hypothetical protein WC370_04500 [Dehalococcoidales bacterium]